MKQTALITGASSGIGKELAYIHAEHGGDLVLVARSKDKLEVIKQEIEGKYAVEVLIIKKDLSHSSAVNEICEELSSKSITIEYLINNAGFGGQGLFHQREWEKDKEMIFLNILALTELTRHIIPDMVERRRGFILNVSSTASLIPGPLQAVYFATKSYVTSFSHALSRELEGTGVTVTNLMPGATETGFGKHAGLDGTKLFEKTVPVDGVARDGYEAMIDGKMNVVSGVSFSQRILFKLLPFLPKKLVLNMVYDLHKK